MTRVLLLITIVLIIFSCTAKVTKEVTPVDLTIPEYPEAYVIRETVNVRNINSTSGEIIKQLKDGEKVFLIKNQNGWYRVQDEAGESGWLRSDLVGPENLSLTRLASTFVDSLLPGFKSEMYFDKEELYKTVYLVLPEQYYQSRSEAETQARKIGELYQEKVYPGKTTFRIMTRDTESLFTQINLDAVKNPDTPVPIINKGRLITLTELNRQVKVKIAITEDPGDAELLRLARQISAQYDLPYIKAEVYIALDKNSGLEYLNNPVKKPQKPEICLLYYLEDKDGEFYQFDHCAD